MSQKKEDELVIQNAEKRYSDLVEKRDELNANARACFNTRNTLNDEKRKLYEDMQSLIEERKKVGDEITLHKRQRDGYQGAAKQLLEKKRSKRKDVHKGLPGDIGSLKADVKLLEIKQETTPLSLEKEREVLDELKNKNRLINELEEKYGKQEMVLGEIEDMDKTIDDLFAKGDKEHTFVVELSGKMKEFKKRMDDLRKEISHLAMEANKKHEEGLAFREEADKQHRKAMEMREKLMAARKVKWAERAAQRAEIEEHNKTVRDSLGKEKDKVVDDAMEELLKKGKIRMG